VHAGAQPEFGSFTTAPRGRAALPFISFGAQGTPTLGKLSNGTYVNDNLGSPAAGNLPTGIGRVRPLFHIFNGSPASARRRGQRVGLVSAGGVGCGP
jgi:hypothetical protein